MADTIRQDGIILFAKQSGITSFSSLGVIKHSLGTRKVGHTGTLDSFASGLLVVCCGRLTRLASYITEFDKTYDAVIEFGSETDTLEWTGQVVRNALLPQKAAVENALSQFTGELMQTPPLFSALHIHGKRASDIARNGRSAELPARKVTVFQAEAEEFLLDDNDAVKAFRARFSVSKGTYIRSLARDIGKACASAAHLAGLRRISVGGFSLSDAIGFHLLKEFTINNVYAEINTRSTEGEQRFVKSQNVAAHNFSNGRNATRQGQMRSACTDDEITLQAEIRASLRPMTETLARDCGFAVLHALPVCELDFLHGRPLGRKMFVEQGNVQRGQTNETARLNKIVNNAYDTTQKIAVFAENGDFLGMVEERDFAYRYLFVNGT